MGKARYAHRQDGAGESRKERGRDAARDERWQPATGEALTESPPKGFPVKLLGGLPGFAD